MYCKRPCVPLFRFCPMKYQFSGQPRLLTYLCYTTVPPLYYLTATLYSIAPLAETSSTQTRSLMWVYSIKMCDFIPLFFQIFYRLVDSRHTWYSIMLTVKFRLRWCENFFASKEICHPLQWWFSCILHVYCKVFYPINLVCINISLKFVISDQEMYSSYFMITHLQYQILSIEISSASG